ncbi:MAG: MFS transporter, partial [Stackebrandtia sp.]
MKQRRAQFAVAIVFAVHGAVSGNFATRVPWIAERLDLGAGALGLALLSPALGSIVAMPLASKLVYKYGGRPVTQAAITTYAGALALPALMPSLASLCAALFVFGLASGSADAAMKAQGTSLERMAQRPILSRLHGMWSVGTLTGAGIGTAATFGNVDARLHLALIAVALLVLGNAAGVRLPRPHHFPAEESAPAKFAMPSRALVGIAVVGFCAAFAEAVAHTWSAVYIADITGGSAGTASLGFVVFVACMAVSRLAGDSVVRRLGPVRTVRVGGLVATVGAAFVVTATEPSAALLGFAVFGLGVAVVAPVALSAAARVGVNGGLGITTVTMIGY